MSWLKHENTKTFLLAIGVDFGYTTIMITSGQRIQQDKCENCAIDIAILALSASIIFLGTFNFILQYFFNQSKVADSDNPTIAQYVRLRRYRLYFQNSDLEADTDDALIALKQKIDTMSPEEKGMAQEELYHLYGTRCAQICRLECNPSITQAFLSHMNILAYTISGLASVAVLVLQGILTNSQP